MTPVPPSTTDVLVGFQIHLMNEAHAKFSAIAKSFHADSIRFVRGVFTTQLIFMALPGCKWVPDSSRREANPLRNRKSPFSPRDYTIIEISVSIPVGEGKVAEKLSYVKG